MKAKLISHWGAQSGSEFWIGAAAAIGRGGGNDVQLDAKAVSSRHARIFFDAEAGAYLLEDLGSLNGTEIDGTPVVRTERLGRLHLLSFGGVCELLFVAVDVEAEVAPEVKPEDPTPPAGDGTQVDAEPPSLPEALAAAAETERGVTRIEESPVVLPEKLAAPKDDEAAAGMRSEREPEPVPEPTPEHEFVLAVVEDGKILRFPLRTGENLVGRTKGAEVALASRQLSRRHALLVVAGEQVTVRDLGSRNHTYVDDRRIEGDSAVEVEVRSRLRFGLVQAYLLRHDDGWTIPVAGLEG